MKAIGPAVTGPGGVPLPLSAGIDAGGVIYLSGQLALMDGRIVGDDVAQQTMIAIDGIERILGHAGLTLADVVRVAVWITRREDFAAFNAAYSGRFGVPYPARSTVVSELAIPGALVEIEATAVRPSAP